MPTELKSLRIKDSMGTIYQVRHRESGKSYIGKTTRDLARRWREHCRNAVKGRGWVIHNAIRLHGPDAFDVEVLQEAPRQELDAAEKVWIAKLGSLAPNGYNLTIGGDGIVNPSEEFRERLSRAQSARCDDPARRAQLGQYSRDAWSDPEKRASYSAERRSRSADPTYIEKLSARTKRFWDRPEYREKLRQTYATRPAPVLTENSKRKIAVSLRAYSSDSEVKARLAGQAKAQWQDPEFRAKKSANSRETMKRLWRDPVFREKARTAARRKRSDAA